jgi:hypothetical protein
MNYSWFVTSQYMGHKCPWDLNIVHLRVMIKKTPTLHSHTHMGWGHVMVDLIPCKRKVCNWYVIGVFVSSPKTYSL